MFIRKAIYRCMLPAAAILPAWLLIGWSIFGSGGWQFLLVLGGAFVLSVGMLVVSALVRSRREVRSAGAVGVADAVLLGVWYALIVALGFQGPAAPLLLTGVVLLLIGGFWFALWQLLSSAKRGLETVLRDAEQAAYSHPSAGQWPPRSEMPEPGPSGGHAASGDPSVIIVRETPRAD